MCIYTHIHIYMYSHTWYISWACEICDLTKKLFHVMINHVNIWLWVKTRDIGDHELQSCLVLLSTPD